MQQEKIVAIFDQQAATYDEKWRGLAPINAALHLLTRSVFSSIPPTARVLCVGAGTEILYLAAQFPGWHFTAVEPSPAMLEVFRTRAEEAGISERCTFHADYLDSLPVSGHFDAATAFLVSQFILSPSHRADFFHGIATRLAPGGVLVSSDLAGEVSTPEGRSLMEVWFRTMSRADITHDEVEKMRAAYQRDVAILPPADVSDLLVKGGFELPVLFYQAGLIHAWYSKRSASA